MAGQAKQAKVRSAKVHAQSAKVDFCTVQSRLSTCTTSRILTFVPSCCRGRPAGGETSRDFVTFSLRIFFLVQSLETAKLITPTVPPIARWSEVDFPRCKSRLLHFLGRTCALSYFGSFACPAMDSMAGQAKQAKVRSARVSSHQAHNSPLLSVVVLPALPAC